MSFRALITGVAGQDGSYLAEFLLGKGYAVGGVELGPVAHPIAGVEYLHGDICDETFVDQVLGSMRPDEIYHLAAISDLSSAAANPKRTIEVNFVASKKLSEMACARNPKIKIFHALSSRILTAGPQPITEESPLAEPQNPYDESKRKVLEEVIRPMRTEGFFVCGGFLFNHESPRRDSRFVTHKIIEGAVNIAHGEHGPLLLGNIDAQRDWGFAGDYVEAMWLMLQQPEPDDYVVATGEAHTVREFVTLAFEKLQLPIVWDGSGLEEQGINPSGEVLVKIDEKFYRPTETYPMIGNSTKLCTKTGWRPKVTFDALIEMMLAERLRLLKIQNR